MACATCHGKKTIKVWKTTFQWRRPNQLVSMEKPEGPMGDPCPECSKPFARPHGPVNVRFGEKPQEYQIALETRGDWHGGAGVEDAARWLNHAVEQREAKLRGALDSIQKLLGPINGQVPFPEIHARCAGAFTSASAALDGSAEAIIGDEACGLAFDQGVWQAAVRELQLLVDALTDDNPTERAAIAGFLRAKGVAEEPAYEIIIGGLRMALREGINHIAQNWGSSSPAFRVMTRAFDDTSKDTVRLEVGSRRSGKTHAMLTTMTDGQLIGELRRRAIRYNETGRSVETERMLQALGVTERTSDRSEAERPPYDSRDYDEPQG